VTIGLIGEHYYRVEMSEFIEKQVCEKCSTKLLPVTITNAILQDKASEM